MKLRIERKEHFSAQVDGFVNDAKLTYLEAAGGEFWTVHHQ